MILVTGGTGLLGSHLIPELLLSGEKVRAIIREGSDNSKLLKIWQQTYQEPEALFSQVEWFRGDILNKASVSEAMEGIEKVYHCAAMVSFEPSKKKEMFEANVIGTRNMVDSCLQKEVKKLLHVSSIAAIGPGNEDELLTEENRWLVNPKGIYSLTKTMAEQEVWRGICEGLQAVIINPSLILGAGMPGQSSARIFETIKKGMKFYTKGINGFVDVKDVVRAMILLMNHEVMGERFIVNAVNISYRELFTKIAHAIDVKAPAWYASPLLTSLAWRTGTITSKFTGNPPLLTREGAGSAHKIQQYSSEKLKKLTGFTFNDLDESIISICRFYKDSK
jgi:dihydroflavonol-4-reductase